MNAPPRNGGTPSPPNYVKRTSSWLSPGGVQLLVTVEYDEQKMKGPPFSVSVPQLRNLFGERLELLSEAEVIESNPRFKDRGLASLMERVWTVASG